MSGHDPEPTPGPEQRDPVHGVDVPRPRTAWEWREPPTGGDTADAAEQDLFAPPPPTLPVSAVPEPRPWWQRFRGVLILVAAAALVLSWGALRGDPEPAPAPAPAATGAPTVPTSAPSSASSQPSAPVSSAAASTDTHAAFESKDAAAFFLTTFETRGGKNTPEKILDTLRPTLSKAAFTKAEQQLRAWDWNGCVASNCAIGTELSLLTEPFGPGQGVYDVLGTRYTGGGSQPESTVVYRVQVEQRDNGYVIVDFRDVTPSGGE